MLNADMSVHQSSGEQMFEGWPVLGVGSARLTGAFPRSICLHLCAEQASEGYLKGDAKDTLSKTLSSILLSELRTIGTSAVRNLLAALGHILQTNKQIPYDWERGAADR